MSEVSVYRMSAFCEVSGVVVVIMAHGEVYSIQHYVLKFVSDLIQHYVLKFVSDLRQVCGFLQLPPPIKLTAMIKLKYC